MKGGRSWTASGAGPLVAPSALSFTGHGAPWRHKRRRATSREVLSGYAHTRSATTWREPRATRSHFLL
jgi:hypothetical protein